ncbi:MAG: hypothetical protein RMH97_04895, partial [Verrucomicrobiales bacterium]|nr:hypothetical protein [Verrucomicrobiales bacterium]
MKTYRQQVCLFALAAVAMACGSGYSASRYVVLDLGVPPQAKGSCACGLNEAGVVVGFAAFEQPGGQVYPRAFAWHDGTWIELGVPGADQA